MFLNFFEKLTLKKQTYKIYYFHTEFTKIIDNENP